LTRIPTPFFAVLLWAALSLSAATAFGEPPVAHASRLAAAPALDGEVLGDEAWKGLAPASGFRQTTPDEGQPASERTEVFLGFTDETFYIGVVCHDADPAGIIVSDSRRDASLEEGDSFQVIFDTFRDRQSGFVFGTNPAGIEYDGQVTREGSGGFGLSAGGFNLNWDGAWEVRAKISESGWSAELAIPFKTLRYGREEVQSWGINFQRNIRRRNETSFWAPLPRQHGLHRLSLAGTVQGIKAPPLRNLKLIPYVLAQSSEGGEDDGTESDQEIGLDVKYSLTPSLTLDATVNTDFAQVESDEQQVNLDRFSLFFPEKRPFFLENAGQLSVGVPEEIELFFSRRIGIGDGGEEIPIVGGLRLSGKVGAATNVGLLAIRAEEVGGVAPENDFTVARLSRELPNRSSVGVLVVERQGHDDIFGDDRNSTYALDGRWGLGKNGQLVGFVARTETPGVEEDDYAFRLDGSFDSEDWSYSMGYTEVAEGFNPEVGFLAREDYRKASGFVLRRIRPKKFWGLHEVRPHISARGFWGFDGFQETGFVHIDNHFEWPSGLELHTGVNLTREGVRDGGRFEIGPDVYVEPGTYDHEEGQIVFNTNQGAALSFSARLTAGGLFGGDRLSVAPTLRYRVGETFNTELSWNHNDLDLPGGAFKTNLGRLRLSYSFTPRISLQALVQYNDRQHQVATNFRFAWLQDANAGFFVVYNEVEETGSAGLGRPERALIVKYSRIFDLLR
jgi:hypothetical protein